MRPLSEGNNGVAERCRFHFLHLSTGIDARAVQFIDFCNGAFITFSRLRKQSPAFLQFIFRHGRGQRRLALCFFAGLMVPRRSNSLGFVSIRSHRCNRPVAALQRGNFVRFPHHASRNRSLLRVCDCGDCTTILKSLN